MISVDILFGNMLLNIKFATSVICLRYVCVIVYALFLFLLFVLCDGDCLIINIYVLQKKIKWYYAKAIKWSYNFLAICDRLFAICRAVNTKLFFGNAAFAVTKK